MRIELEYPPHPDPSDTRETWERRALNPWRMEQKRRLMRVRGGLCERLGCGRRADDLDEPLVTRGDMGGLSLEQRRLAFSSANMEIACARCNRESAHDRDGAWARAVARYGEDTMKKWYVSLRLKAPRPGWMP